MNDTASDTARRCTLAIIAHLALIAAWYLFVTFGNVPKFVMPSPVATLNALLQPNYAWWTNIAVTGTEIFAGYFLALGAGVVLALAFSWSKTLESFFLPLLVSLNMIPKVALGPLIIVGVVVAYLATLGLEGRLGSGGPLARLAAPIAREAATLVPKSARRRRVALPAGELKSWPPPAPAR